MLGKTQNPQLQQVEQAVQAKVPPNLQNAFQRIVTAGLKVMYSDDTRQMLMNQLKQPGEPTELAGQGIAKMMAILYQKSKGTMPMRAAIPAAQVLLCEGLDFMANAGMIQISADTIASSTKEMVTYLLQIFGFSKDKMQKYIQAGIAHHGAAPDASAPADMAAPAAAPAPASAGIIASARGA